MDINSRWNRVRGQGINECPVTSKKKGSRSAGWLPGSFQKSEDEGALAGDGLIQLVDAERG